MRPLGIPFPHLTRFRLNSRWYPPCIQSTRTVAETTSHKHFEKRHQLMAPHTMTQRSSTDPDQGNVQTGARSVGSVWVAARAGAGSCSTVACCPSRSSVTRTVSPSGNSSASWCMVGRSRLICRKRATLCLDCGSERNGMLRRIPRGAQTRLRSPAAEKRRLRARRLLQSRASRRHEIGSRLACRPRVLERDATKLRL